MNPEGLVISYGQKSVSDMHTGIKIDESVIDQCENTHQNGHFYGACRMEKSVPLVRPRSFSFIIVKRNCDCFGFSLFYDIADLAVKVNGHV